MVLVAILLPAREEFGEDIVTVEEGLFDGS